MTRAHRIGGVLRLSQHLPGDYYGGVGPQYDVPWPCGNGAGFFRGDTHHVVPRSFVVVWRLVYVRGPDHE